jgi:hypothetical protein
MKTSITSAAVKREITARLHSTGTGKKPASKKEVVIGLCIIIALAYGVLALNSAGLIREF